MLLSNMYKPNQYLQESKAKEVASQLQLGDSEGWLYLVVPYDFGYRIAVFDEDKLFVAYWGGF